MSFAGPLIPARRLLPCEMYIRRNRVQHSRATGVKRKISTVLGAAFLSIKLSGKQQLEKPRKQLLESNKGQR